MSNVQQAPQRPAAVVARSVDEPGSSSILRQRVAALTRTIDARDETIATLVAQLQKAKCDPVSQESLQRSRALNCVFCDKREELETKTRELKEALSRLSKAEKMMSIGQLAAGIAHELNTPIQYVTDNVLFLERAFNVLVNALDRSRGEARPYLTDHALLEEEHELQFLRDDLPDAIEQSRDGLRRIAAIVTAMKNFTHPSDNVMSPSNLTEIIETTIAVSRNEWKYVADIETHFTDEFSEVSCIRDDIEKVVLNLLINAGHAIAQALETQPPGTRGKITVTTRRQNDFAEILIADTGPGIPSELKDRVFEAFFTTKPVGVGTGQGLAIARTCIVDHHHGELFFESEEGHGTTFHIRLPLNWHPGMS